jgi:inhibitor of KinA sporulation pathway (predicted exonuclease)
MNYIVFDLEYNQPFKINSNNIHYKLLHEILEIGAVKLNENLEIIDTFRIYVKPEVYKKINPRVVKLTKITQYDLQYSFPFTYCYEQFIKWIGSEFILCCWGSNDILELLSSCNFYNIDISWLKVYINVQYMYMKIYNLNMDISLKNAIENSNFKIEDEMHNALNDAKYTAKIFKALNIENINDFIINYNTNIQSGIKIRDINDERINKHKLKTKCVQCGCFTKPMNEWLWYKKEFRRTSYCNKCDNYIFHVLKIHIVSENELNYNHKRKLKKFE